eukprot:7628581-Pyramimonas_sp.AAC.1
MLTTPAWPSPLTLGPAPCRCPRARLAFVLVSLMHCWVDWRVLRSPRSGSAFRSSCSQAHPPVLAGCVVPHSSTALPTWQAHVVGTVGVWRPTGDSLLGPRACPPSE